MWLRLVIVVGAFGCVSSPRSQNHSDMERSLVDVGISVDDFRSPPTLEADLVRALERRHVKVGRSGDWVHFIVGLVGECLPVAVSGEACGDSTRIVATLLSADPLGPRTRYPYDGFRGERSSFVRL